MDKYLARLKNEDDPTDTKPVATVRQCIYVFDHAAVGINASYFPQAAGFMAWLMDKQPLLYRGIKRLEELMATPVQDGVTLGDFEAMVAEWELLHKQGIELYFKAKEKK